MKEQFDNMFDKFQSVIAIIDQTRQHGYEYYAMAANGTATGYKKMRIAAGRNGGISLFFSK